MGASTAALPALQQPSMRKWRLRVYTAQSTRLAHCCSAAPGAVLRSISARPCQQIAILACAQTADGSASSKAPKNAAAHGLGSTKVA